jgi:hypothetical protein
MSEATTAGNADEEQAERLRELAALDITELSLRQAKAAETLIEVRGGLAEAVTREDYAVAAGLKTKEGILVAEVHELKEAHATASHLRKKRAREELKANTNASGLPLVTDMVATTDKVWEEHIREVLVSLEPLLDTARMIVQHCLTLVAAEGIQAFSIRPRMDIYDHGVRTGLLRSQDMPQRWRGEVCDPFAKLARERRQTQSDTSLTKHVKNLHFSQEIITAVTEFETVWQRVTYIVDLGFCWIPVGKGLTEAQYTEFHSFHEAIAGRPCEIEQDLYMAMTTSFDEEVLHSLHLTRVLSTRVGRMQLRWQLNQAGYACAFDKTIGGSTLWLTVAFGVAGDLLRSTQNTSEETLVDKSTSFLDYTQKVMINILPNNTQVGLKKFWEEEKLRASQ